MKKKLVSLLTVTAMTFSMLVGCGSEGSAETTQPATTDTQTTQTTETTDTAQTAEQPAATSDFADKKVGVCIYQFSDNFMTLFRNEMENYLISQGFSKENITIVDGANDQATQTNQIQNFITQGVDVLVINPVNSSSAATITDLVVDAGIPLVYINREPDADEEARWADNNWNVTYVGCDARQSGTYQGEIIVDLGQDKVDLNGDGKIQYIMIEGDPENVDAQYRTEFSVKALEDAGWTVDCLDDEVGNWDQATAQQLVANALSEALEDVIAGTMTGTVFNDHISQSHSAADAAINYIKGDGNDHYIGCDYVKVTSDNAQQILDSLK
ncbi:MAG: substrate-binding domain-containing protein [Butyrivibrio sp.]|nr:substrate-binding domain-containing protein [Butyrivibrio sp.]